MRSDAARKTVEQQRPWRLLLWATLASLICGIIGFGQIAEDALRIARNGLHPTAASGDIVFVGIDDKSLSEVGKWPWSRAVQAKMIEKAKAAGADRVFVDLIYDSPGTPQEDAAFEEMLKVNGKSVILADRAAVGVRSDLKTPSQILPRFRKLAKTANITVWYNWQLAIWRLPFKEMTPSGLQSSFAYEISEARPNGNGKFPIDYSIAPATVPYVSASQVLQGEGTDLQGKTVIIGLNADQLGDQFWIPGYGKMAGAYVHILGAETLKLGRPVDLGWLLPLLAALAACGAAIAQRQPAYRGVTLVTAGSILLVLPLFLERALMFIDVVPGGLAVAIVSARLTWIRMRNRSMLNDATGLPTLRAMRLDPTASSQALIVAKVHNHAEISAATNEREGRDISRQIVSRLSAGGTPNLYQGDDGTFAWLFGNDVALGHHLEALHAMFRAPIAIGGRQIDVALSFGVEIGSSRTIGSRLASAVLAADEAWTEGLRWKLHDPARQEEMNWRVSLLGELDSAIDNGEVWLAYQPQFDIKRGQIIGAEALARWTHPQKGPISPSEFVAAAEANGRIRKLTDFVLERSISSAAAINRRGVPFQVAVNLSARLLTDRDLLTRIEQILQEHGLPPARLTLELTETASLQDAESGIATLDSLRQLGIRIAIDDYGTGLSTLDYLKKVPANEIKIDQSFVKSMRVNKSDLIMVQSTIALAHSLGRTVVAEGVEDQQCLDELTRMGCDVAQGFAIGRPMGVRELVQRLQVRSARRVA